MRASVGIVLLVALGACNPIGDHYQEQAKKQRAESVAREKAVRAQDSSVAAGRRADGCESCHPAIVAEWRRSMHAHATAKGDPLYAVVVKEAAAVLGADGAERQCRQCHYADFSRAQEALNRDPVGVSCMVCHQIAVGHPRPLASGEVSVLARAQGQRDGQNGLCLSCHAGVSTTGGVPACTTGPARAAAGDCVDCHMGAADGPAVVTHPENDSHSSHDFIGGHDDRFLRGAARIELARDGDELAVTVAHGSAGHAVPTGNPMRFLVARVDQLDAAGKIVATNAGGNASPPLGITPVFMRVFSNAGGQRPVQPFASSGAPIDTTLEPGDRKSMRIPIARGAVKARAVLEYHRAPDALLEAAGLPIDSAPMSRAELEL